MRFKSTLGMAIALGTIGTYYFFVDIPQEERKKKEKERAEKILQFEKDQIKSLTLKKKDQFITIQKKGGSWNIEKPLQVKADPDAADFLINVLKNARFTRVVDDNPSDLAAFGLQNPQLEVTLRGPENKEQTLWLGDNAPIGSLLYVQRKDEPKVLLSPTDRNDLDKSLYDLRDKTVLKVSAQEVADLELSGQNAALHLTQKDKQWTLNNKDIKGKAESSKITSMLNALDQAKAQSFVEEKPADLITYGLNPPYLKIALSFQDGSKHLLIGKLADKSTRFAKTNHAQNIITVADSLVNSFSLKPLDYLSKTLIEFEQKQVKNFSVQSNDTEIRLTLDSKESDKWIIQKPIKTAADKATVNSLLFDLKDTHIARYVQSSVKDFKPFGLDPPKQVFKMETQDGVVHSLKLGNKTDNDKKIFSSRPGETNVFLLETADVEKIFRSLHDLRDKKLLTVNTRDVQKIHLNYPDRTFELIKRGDAWSLVQPLLIENIKEFVGPDILWTLNTLEFSHILEIPPDLKTKGLDPPHLTVRLWDADEKLLETLHIGKPSNSEKFLYAQVKGKTKLYQIQKRFLEEMPSDLEKFKN